MQSKDKPKNVDKSSDRKNSVKRLASLTPKSVVFKPRISDRIAIKSAKYLAFKKDQLERIKNPPPKPVKAYSKKNQCWRKEE